MIVSIRDVFDLIVYLYRRITTENFNDLKKKAWQDTLSCFNVQPVEILQFCDDNVDFQLNKLKNGVKEIEILPLVKRLIHIREITYSEIDPQQFILTFLDNLKEQMEMHPHYSKVIKRRVEYERGRVKPWRIGYQELIEACMKLTHKHLLKMKGKYDRSLYVERKIEKEFKEFMKSDSKCFLVVDRAGMGKTNFTCWIAEEYGKENPTIILPGSVTVSRENDFRELMSEEVTHFLTIPESVGIDELAEVVKIKNSIEVELHQEQKENSLDIKKVLRFESKKEKRFLLVIIDGINENQNRRLMKYALQDLLCESEEKDIKFLITCREIFWEYFDDDFWKEFVYEPDTLSERPWVYVSEFNDGQFDQAWEKYKSRYHIEGELVSDAREKCKHPLMLRFFCEAYAGENINLCRNFTKKEVFDKYWEKKLKQIESNLQYQHSQQEVARFLLSMAEEMKNRSSKGLTDEEITRVTGITDFISPNSIYRRILDEDIIIEEEIGETCRRVNFTYENFMEYTMAKSIMEQWRSKENEKILDEFKELGNQAQDFENLYGVIDYLIIMMEISKDLQIAMLQKASEWRSSFLDSISVLEDIPDNIFDILLRFSMSENIRLRHRVAEILKRFIGDHPEECMKIVEQLVERPDERTQKTVIPYLVELAEFFPENAFHLLETQSNSETAQKVLEEICPFCTDMILDMIRRWDRYRIRDNADWIQRLLITIAEQRPEGSIQLLNELKNSHRFPLNMWELTITHILEQEPNRKRWFIETFCEENDLQVQRVIVSCLKSFIDQNDKEIFLVLMKWSEFENPWPREISAGLLGKIGESRMSEIILILKKLCHDENVRVRIAVCNSLIEIMEFDSSLAHELLLEVLQESNFEQDPFGISETERETNGLDDERYEEFLNYFGLKSSIVGVIWEFWIRNPENCLEILDSKKTLNSLVRRFILSLPMEIIEELEETVLQDAKQNTFVVSPL